VCVGCELGDVFVKGEVDSGWLIFIITSCILMSHFLKSSSADHMVTSSCFYGLQVQPASLTAIACLR